MQIEPQSYVSIAYTLTLDSGEVVDQSEPGRPLGFLFGCGQLIPGLERQLEGLGVGDKVQLVVEAEEGYGAHQPELVQAIPRTSFPADALLEPGMVFQGSGPHGPVTIRIAGLAGDQVMADFNHPLAGERLHFALEVTEVRPASQEELDALAEGPECGPDGCQGCGCH